MSLPAIRAVLFDFDGVLTTDAYGSTSTLRALHRSTGLPEAALRDAYVPHLHALVSGHATHADIWPALVARLGHDVPLDALRAAFEATPMSAPMLALARRLRRAVRTGIVTDNTCDRMDVLVRMHALDTLFDPIVVSAAVGLTKRGRGIFEHALDRLAVAPDEALFIDNTAANLEPAAALGLHVEHFDDVMHNVPALEARLRTGYGLGVD